MVVIAIALYLAHVTSDDLTFLASVLIGTWIVSAWLSPIRRRLFPPELELSGEFEGLLFGPTPDVDDTDESFIEPDQHQDIRKRVGRARDIESSLKAQPSIDHPAVSTIDRENWSLESVAIKGAFLVLLGAFVWGAVRPIVYQTFPDLHSTLRGPGRFPITVHIGEEDFTVTNGSTAAWTCTITVGREGQYKSDSFAVDSHSVHILQYSDFHDPENETPSNDLAMLARDNVRAECNEPSGPSHFLDLR